MIIKSITIAVATPNDFLFEGVHWIFEILIVIVLFLFLWVCVCVRAIRYFWKFPMPAFMGNAIAAGSYRNRVQPPSMIVDALGLEPGMNIVEIGCGSGLYTVAVAKAVEPGGTVYAVDIQEEMLEKLRNRMNAEGIDNIVPILADAEGMIGLEDNIADAAFSVTVMPEIPDPVEALRQVKRLMKDGAVYADAELLFDPDYPLMRTVKKWCKEAGLVYEKQFGSRLSYVLVFRKPQTKTHTMT